MKDMAYQDKVEDLEDTLGDTMININIIENN